MKTLIITNLFPNAAQPGRGLFNAQQAVALARRGEVRVIAPVPWRPGARRVPARDTYEGLEVHHPRFASLPLLSRPFNALFLYWGIRRTVRRLAGCDRLLATWAYPDVVAASWLARELRLPLVAKLHGSDVHVFSRGPLRRRLITAALRRAHGIVAVSGAIRDEVVRWGLPASAVTVIPNGVDTQRFRPQERAACREALGLPEAGRLVVFVGNLVPVKGADVLLDAFRKLAASDASVRLAVVGSGPQEVLLRRQAQGLEPRVRFAGPRPHAEIPQWLNAADVVCAPSRSEGCPNLVLEALACGTPVVGTRAGGIPEVVRDGETGLLAPPSDPKGLASALTQALARAWDRARIAASVAGRSWERTAQQLDDVLRAARAPAHPLTVLHVLRYSVPQMSGYTVRSQALVEGQHALGLRPVVVTSARHEAPQAREEVNGIPYYRCRPSRLPGVGRLLDMAALRRRILEVARREGADVIHAHSPALCGLPALLAARALRRPFLYEVRALWEDAAVDQDKTAEGSLTYRLSRRLETYVLRRADRIVVICEGLKRELAQRGLPADRIAISPNGVDPDAFRPAAGKDAGLLARYRLGGQKVVGFIGSFFQFEGLETLLQAAPLMRRQDPAVRVLIVGAGEQDARLRQQAARQGLDGAVVFAGRVPHGEVQAYYSIMDVLVYPRLSRRITELVTPLKPLEAMALARPVVASDVGGLRELVRDGETGLLFKAGDPEDLAAKCIQLLRDGALASRLARQGRSAVERERSWRLVCERTAAVYRELLAQPSALSPEPK